MGLNILGFVINKNYQKKFEDLQKELPWKIKKLEEINFETASSSYKDDGICDVYFSEKGTLLLINTNRVPESWGVTNANTLFFLHSDTSTTFCLSYSENGIEKREIVEAEYERLKDEGEKLKVEDISEDTSEIIFNQIEVVLGKRFWDIDQAERAERYAIL